MERNNITYDILLLEADRVDRLRKKDLELYYKNLYGEIVPLAEGYDPAVEELIASLFKKKRLRYLITFTEALDIQDELKPSTLKMLRFMAKEMTFGNVFKGYGHRDIASAIGMNTRYIVKSLSELCDKDIVRFKVDKGRRVYMVNPIYFYKGSMKSIFQATRNYEQMPKLNADLEVEYEFKELE